jgi:hypothetical protein
MNWKPLVVAWIFLGVATLGLALYRKFLSMKEEDYIHLEAWRAPRVAAQETMARKMHAIDRCGETLSVLTVLGGLVLAFAWVYAALNRG